MRSLFVALRLDTDSRQLELVTQLDKSIDDVCIVAFFAHRSLTQSSNRFLVEHYMQLWGNLKTRSLNIWKNPLNLTALSLAMRRDYGKLSLTLQGEYFPPSVSYDELELTEIIKGMHASLHLQAESLRFRRSWLFQRRIRFRPT
jgi:hypothetical protein